MELHRIGERNLTIAFQEPFYTTVHLIFGDQRVYVCDTFLGPDSMEEIARIIKENGHQDKPIVVFNSHADWDHVWGNSKYGWVGLLLRGGSKVYGYWDYNSEASWDVEHRDIYLSSVFEVDADGNWSEVPKTGGILVNGDDIVSIHLWNDI